MREARTARQLWLPDQLSYPPRHPLVWLLWLGLGWLPWLRVGVELQQLVGWGWTAVGGWALCTWGLWRWSGQRRTATNPDLPSERGGWHIDMEQRRLQRAGPLHPLDADVPTELRLEPAQDWSLGTLIGTNRNRAEPYIWFIELRHARRGPVATLCEVCSWSHGQPLLQDLDGLVDTLTLRLGVRRSGSRLAAGPAPRSRTARI